MRQLARRPGRPAFAAARPALVRRFARTGRPRPLGGASPRGPFRAILAMPATGRPVPAAAIILPGAGGASITFAPFVTRPARRAHLPLQRAEIPIGIPVAAGFAVFAAPVITAVIVTAMLLPRPRSRGILAAVRPGEAFVIGALWKSRRCGAADTRRPIGRAFVACGSAGVRAASPVLPGGTLARRRPVLVAIGPFTAAGLPAGRLPRPPACGALAVAPAAALLSATFAGPARASTAFHVSPRSALSRAQ